MVFPVSVTDSMVSVFYQGVTEQVCIDDIDRDVAETLCNFAGKGYIYFIILLEDA